METLCSTRDLKAGKDLYRATLPVMHDRDFCMFIRRIVLIKSPRTSRGSSLGIKQLMIFKTMCNVLNRTFNILNLNKFAFNPKQLHSSNNDNSVIQTLSNECSRGVKQYQSINQHVE